MRKVADQRLASSKRPTNVAQRAEHGSVARAARYDARRAVIVISLEDSCELSFPTALAEELADTPRSKLAKIEISPNGTNG